MFYLQHKKVRQQLSSLCSFLWPSFRLITIIMKCSPQFYIYPKYCKLSNEYCTFEVVWGRLDRQCSTKISAILLKIFMGKITKKYVHFGVRSKKLINIKMRKLSILVHSLESKQAKKLQSIVTTRVYGQCFGVYSTQGI